MITLGTQSAGGALEVGVVDDLTALSHAHVPGAIHPHLTQIHGMVIEGVGRVKHIFLHLFSCVLEEQTRVVAFLRHRAVPSAMLDIVGHVEIGLAGGVACHDHVIHLFIGVVAQVGCPRTL